MQIDHKSTKVDPALCGGPNLEIGTSDIHRAYRAHQACEQEEVYLEQLRNYWRAIKISFFGSTGFDEAAGKL